MDSRDPAEDWYSVLGADLSQGDIVRDVPFGLIDAPITICQPNNTAEQGKANYYPLTSIPRRRSVEFLHAKFNLGLGIVVWPDCQIDKPKNQGRPEKEWIAAIAPVIPLSKLASELHSRVKAFKRAQWFPLPAKAPEIIEDCYVDLRHVWPIRHALAQDRVIALSEPARQAFSLHRFWFDTEAKMRPEVECPHCHQQIDTSVLFQYQEESD
jgi:hypothetical protein